MMESFEPIEPVDSASCRMVWSILAKLSWPIEAIRAVWVATSLTSFMVFSSSFPVAEISLTATAAWLVEA